jgi:ubiquinone/menaquinone biosynthesis C-methylase UbiE
MPYALKTGIDYSEEMIDACKKRFSDYSSHISFKVCYVRSMKMFDENTFDFILFSFNGIDLISHNERLKAFDEIKRIGKPGSCFCGFRNTKISNFYLRTLLDLS